MDKPIAFSIKPVYNTTVPNLRTTMKRYGFTLVEISAAIALLAVYILAFAQLAAMTASTRTAERTRQTAVDQMQNVLERLATVSPEKLIAGDFDKKAAETLIERSLPEGKIVFDVKEQSESGCVLFTVTVSWSAGDQRPRSEAAMFRLLPLSSSVLPADNQTVPTLPKKEPLPAEEEMPS